MGSVGGTPKSSRATPRASRGAATAPATMPGPTAASPSRRTAARIAPRSAPSAMRMPISRVRRTTPKATTPPRPITVTASARAAKADSRSVVRRGATRALGPDKGASRGVAEHGDGKGAVPVGLLEAAAALDANAQGLEDVGRGNAETRLGQVGGGDFSALDEDTARDA